MTEMFKRWMATTGGQSGSMLAAMFVCLFYGMYLEWVSVVQQGKPFDAFMFWTGCVALIGGVGTAMGFHFNLRAGPRGVATGADAAAGGGDQ